MSKRGVKPGYSISNPGWKYRGVWKERKTGWRNWSGVFRFTKRRPSKGYGGHPKGRTIGWWIRGKQILKKVGRGKYRGNMYFRKRLIGTGFKK